MRARIQFLFLQILMMLIVPLLFRWIEDRKLAAVIAGGLFVSIPMTFLILDFRNARKGIKVQNQFLWSWRLAVIQFLGLFAIPIFSLRVLYWESDFKDLSFFGLPGPLLHRLSNGSFLIMFVATAFMLISEYLWQKKQRASNET